ncbi:MAG: hypothetical protein GY950_01780, partial [bacterium]|nr:hypothetical protein [bacterium]
MDNTVQSARAYLFDPVNAGDVDLKFTPLFKGTPSGNVYSGHGIHVELTTGTVSVDAAVPAVKKNNFMMEVEAENTSDGKIFTELIRIHIHTSVVETWLTPSKLRVRSFESIRPELTPYRFSVRAQFDDGTLADLTHLTERNDSTGTRDITWGPAPHVHPVGKLRINAGEAPGDEFDITATLPAYLGGVVATGRMAIIDSWADDTQRTAFIVPGGGTPGFLAPDRVPNFLFLGDGFRADDEAKFDQLVNSIVHHIKTSRLTRPFDILSTSMNFWKVFVPTLERGISVSCEVYPTQRSGKDVAYAVPNPEKPPPAGGWLLKHLIYAVGLPVPEDDLSNAARSNEDIRDEWAQLVDPNPSPHVSNGLLNSWRRMAKRTFIEEQDSAFGQAYGIPPTVSIESDNLQTGFHSGRPDRDQLNRFLEILEDEHGNNTGSLWAESGGTRPTNFDFVFIISSSKRDRGVNYFGYISMNVEDRGWFEGVESIAGKNALRWQQPGAFISSISSSISRVRSGRAIHEIAHSFGLGDEYADLEESFSGTADDLKVYGNLQEDDDVKKGGNIHGDEIKWNWHRIKNAGVINGTITSSGGGDWHIPLVNGHGLPFSIGDTVFLRKRKYPKPLLKNPQKNKNPLVITEPSDADFVTVKGKSDIITHEEFENFTTGDILYTPVPAPGSVRSAAYPYAEMVAKNIKDYISDKQKPLTKFPCVQYPGDKPQEPIIPGVDLPFCFKSITRIVGLYSGGRRHHCGIYHPTGNCMMRGNKYDSLEFCAVC